MSVQNSGVIYTHCYKSPIGTLHLAVNRGGSVLRISYTAFGEWPKGLQLEENKYACGELEHELDEYFRGHLRHFTIPVSLDGTQFQRSVWKRLAKIEYGSTVTYGEIARKIGRARAARAVGNAVAGNPAPIVIPCHRVVSADRGLGQYALRAFPPGDGSRLKRKLLELEGAL